MSEINKDTNNGTSNNTYSDIGEEIKDQVNQAVASGDFSNLSSVISQTVAGVLGEVGNGINQASSIIRTSVSTSTLDAMNQAREQARLYHEQQEAKLRANKEKRSQYVVKPGQSTGAVTSNKPVGFGLSPSRVKFINKGAVSGPISVLMGASGTIVFGTLFISNLSYFFDGGFTVADVVLLSILFGGFLLASVLSLISGINKNRMLDKAKKIRKLCCEKLYCTVDDIVSATGTDRNRTVKDIKKILAKGFFPEGYMDEDNTTFMASDAVYKQYQDAEKNRMLREAEEAKKLLDNQDVNPDKTVTLTPEQQAELAAMIREGNKSCSRLHELNDSIPGEAITEKLNTTEKLLTDIFARVKEHPEQMKNCHKLMDYHLPTMLKLVEAYGEYDKVSVPGDDIIKAKEEIEKTIDVINQAFTELLNRLFRDSVWDVTADAKVLKSMLSQDGLTGDIGLKNTEEV